MNHDVLTEMLTELREALPTEAQWPAWLEAVSQVIAAYPTEERRKACLILVSNDLATLTGVPWWECAKPIYREMEKRKEVTR